MTFSKLYKGPKRYFPGDILKCSLESSGTIELDEESVKVLKAMLSREKNEIKERAQKLFPGKQLNFTKKPVELPCPLENFLYQGPKLKRHLQSKCHKFSGETAKTCQSLVRAYINQITSIVKHKSSKPTMCYISKDFLDRIDSHYNNFHQLRRQPTQLGKALQKSIIATKEFLSKYYKKTTKPVSSSDYEIPESSPSSTVSINPSPSSTVLMNPTNPKSKVMLSETVKRDPRKHEKKLEKEKIPHKMPQSSSGEIQLTGVFEKPTPEMQKQMVYLNHKLPMTKILMKNRDILVADNFKYYYETAELLLED